MPAAYAADLAWHMAGRYRPPDALHRADTPARPDPPAATTPASPTDQADARNAADARILRSGLRCINMQTGRPQVELTGARRATDMAKVPLDNGALTRRSGRVDGCGHPAAHTKENMSL